MKKLLYLPVIALMFSGCASQEAYNAYLASKAVNDANYYEVASKPLVDIVLPAPDGQEYKIVVNRDIKPLETKQIKDSEWTTPVTAAIVGATLVGGKAFDWKIKQSDNDAAVLMNDSDNRGTTEQVKSYVTEFKKETLIPIEPAQ